MAGRTVGLVALIAFGTGSTGAITASVRDVSGAVSRGAAIPVKHVEAGLTRAAQTDASGNFTIPSLPVRAYYEVTAENLGFRSAAGDRPPAGGKKSARLDANG